MRACKATRGISRRRPIWTVASFRERMSWYNDQRLTRRTTQASVTVSRIGVTLSSAGSAASDVRRQKARGLLVDIGGGLFGVNMVHLLSVSLLIIRR
jgi:hypothetical protein